METAVIWINSTRLNLKFIRLLEGVFAQLSKHLICISADGSADRPSRNVLSAASLVRMVHVVVRVALGLLSSSPGDYQRGLQLKCQSKG